MANVQEDRLVIAKSPRLAGVLLLLVSVVGAVAFAAPSRDAAADSANPPAVYRAVVPGISGDSASPAPSTGSVSPLVTVQNVLTTLPGGLWVNGEVHNGLDTTIGSVSVTATASDPGGAVVATKTVNLGIDAIGAGQNGPFRILLPGALQANLKVAVTVNGYAILAGPALNDQVQISATGPRPLEIQTPDTTKHIIVVTISNNLAAIDGTITNNSGQAIVRPQVFVAVYDGDGHVAMLSTTSPVSVQYQTDPVVLAPGATGSFTVLVPIPDYYQVQGSVKLVGFLGPSGS